MIGALCAGRLNGALLFCDIQVRTRRIDIRNPGQTGFAEFVLNRSNPATDIEQGIRITGCSKNGIDQASRGAARTALSIRTKLAPSQSLVELILDSLALTRHTDKTCIYDEEPGSVYRD
jgi:hypothetical protein